MERERGKVVTNTFLLVSALSLRFALLRAATRLHFINARAIRSTCAFAFHFDLFCFLSTQNRSERFNYACFRSTVPFSLECSREEKNKLVFLDPILRTFLVSDPRVLCVSITVHVCFAVVLSLGDRRCATTEFLRRGKLKTESQSCTCLRLTSKSSSHATSHRTCCVTAVCCGASDQVQHAFALRLGFFL
jgi:hypothetical protein